MIKRYIRLFREGDKTSRLRMSVFSMAMVVAILLLFGGAFVVYATNDKCPPGQDDKGGCKTVWHVVTCKKDEKPARAVAHPWVTEEPEYCKAPEPTTTLEPTPTLKVTEPPATPEPTEQPVEPTETPKPTDEPNPTDEPTSTPTDPPPTATAPPPTATQPPPTSEPTEEPVEEIIDKVVAEDICTDPVCYCLTLLLDWTEENVLPRFDSFLGMFQDLVDAEETENETMQAILEELQK